jgi:hypothetical protein
MKVRKGFSTDYAKNKFDVEIDEADLARLLPEHGFPPETKLTTLQAFRLADTLSEWLMLTEAAKISQEMAAKVEPSRRVFYTTVDEVRKELGLEPVYQSFLAGTPTAPE